MMPMMSDSFMIKSSSPSSLTSVPDHLPNNTRSPALTSSLLMRPASSRAPGPTAMISPCEGFSFTESGMMIPPEDFSSASMRLTTTRSCRGRNFNLAMGSSSARLAQVVTEKHRSDKYLALLCRECQDQALRYGVERSLSSGGMDG